MTDNESFSPKNLKLKFYNSMESDEESNPCKRLDKGKGIDREYHPYYGNSTSPAKNSEVTSLELDKGKELEQFNEPPFATWSKVFPGVDPASIFFPKRVNPGAGFNVPGGEVPINEDICKHIDYNSHILNQFKKMDLETAIGQRKNNLTLIRVLESKITYANGILLTVPTIPTTEYEFKLRNQILKDLYNLSKDKIRAEARATLIGSRIEFIENKINKNPTF
jgi:hypothetical protein